MLPTSARKRFLATIRKLGANWFVDVPERISQTFSHYARGGRIRFEGRLNRTPIRGTLIPTGRGRHRLFINGGMRAAAAVALGDRVTVALNATDPDVVRPPADVAMALRRANGARKAFFALSASHRHELLRYIDDARTARNRAQRIERTIEGLRGKSTASRRTRGRGVTSEGSGPPAAAGASPGGKVVTPRPRRLDRPLWTCPRCGNAFVTPNQYHSCERHDLSEPFQGKPPHIRQLFDRFRAMVEACGPVTTVCYRDKVGFMVRVRFAGAVPKSRWLDVGFWLSRRLTSPRLHKVETLGPKAHVHLLRITDPSQLDSELTEWIREAYAVGCRDHLKRG